MRVVILQPSYIPWRGYFDQIRRCDLFIFYDDVQYDHHGWRNRNRVKTREGPQWLSIPVLTKGHIELRRSIKDIEIDWRQRWNHKHLRTLEHAYRKAPYWEQYSEALTGYYHRQDTCLADFTIAGIELIAAELGFTHVDFRRSSEIPAEGSKTDRLLALLTSVGATHYISGPSAEAYLDVALLRRNGVTVEFMQYKYPEYDQLHPPFDPHVSILDLLFMKGPQAASYL